MLRTRPDGNEPQPRYGAPSHKSFELLVAGLPAEVHRRLTNIKKAVGRTQQPILALLDLLRERDPVTYDHCRQVAALARRIAMLMAFEERDCLAAFSAGLLHDVGKLAVPSGLANKPGRLTFDDWCLMRAHPIASYEIIKGRVEDFRVLTAVLRHHERPDGTGYPCRTEEVDPIAAIVSVADAFDALTNTRTYREAACGGDALIELARLSGQQFDAAPLLALQRLWQHRTEPDGSLEDRGYAARTGT